MKAIQILTDKNHYMTELEVFPALCAGGTKKLGIEKEQAFGAISVGVAITGASCYNLSLMEKESRKELLEGIFSNKGMGLTNARLCVGASDYSAELYSYDDVAFDTELEHFSIERDKKYIIPMIKEILDINPGLFLFCSPWSPPGWMKTGGSMCGGYMRREYLDCYARYYIKFLKAYAENGIRISALTPQNEPDTQQNGKMPACIWQPDIEAEFIKILRKKLDESGMDTELWLFDNNFSEAEQRVKWQLDNIEGLAESCSGVAFHYYCGTIEQTKIIKKAYPEHKLHFTEAGPRLNDNYGTDWCKWGVMLSKAIKCGYSSFTGWNLILNEMGGPNIGPYLCGGLVTRDTVSGELSYSGQYKAFAHISPYINENSKLYPVYAGDDFEMPMHAYPKTELAAEGFLIDNSDGKYVIVLINPNEKKLQTQVFVKDTWWYAELTPESISTIIIE